MTQPRRRWSDDQILAAIRTFEAQRGRPPSAADLGGTSMPGYETVRVRFGSLPATTKRAQAAIRAEKAAMASSAANQEIARIVRQVGEDVTHALKPLVTILDREAIGVP